MVADCSSSVPSLIINERYPDNTAIVKEHLSVSQLLDFIRRKKWKLMKFGCCRLIQQSEVKVTFVRCNRVHGKQQIHGGNLSN